MKSFLSNLGLFIPVFALALDPGSPVDYKPLAFNPERWEQGKHSTLLIPWVGEKIVLLTTSTNFDHKVMASMVGTLDRGWGIYADLTGRSPGLFKHIGGRATIAAVPDAGLSCGVGCGYLGVTGIELGKFYQDDYPRMVKNEKDVPHYCFYEMGRNYYTFGGRHDSFTTGFAVFMRYVALDAMKLDDSDHATRQFIEKAESLYINSGMDWLRAFTMQGGLDEKAPRLKDDLNRDLHPSDQPVLYASAMLRLRRECGGDDWVRRFFAELASAPDITANNRENALGQSVNWMLAASCAAGRDLSPLFCDKWRLPVDERIRAVLKQLDWAGADAHLVPLLKKCADAK